MSRRPNEPLPRQNGVKLLRWAQSESEAAALQAQGWRVAEQRLVHHHAFGILLEKDVD